MKPLTYASAREQVEASCLRILEIVNGRRDNPSVSAAVKGYQKFHWGIRPKYGRPIRVPTATGVLYQVGKLHSVAYTTYKRGDGWATYEHKFGEGGGRKPVLATDGRRLFIVGGTYTIRPEGITG